MTLSAQAASLTKQAKSLTAVTHCIVFVIVLNCLLVVLSAYAILTGHYKRWRRNKAAKALTEGYDRLRKQISKTSKDLKTYSSKKSKKSKSKKSKSKAKSKSKSKSKSLKSKSKSKKKDESKTKDKKDKKDKSSKTSKSTSKRRRKVRVDSDREPQQQSAPKETAKLKNVPTGNEKAGPSPLRGANRPTNVPPGSHVVFMGVSEGHDDTATAKWFTEVQTTYPAGKAVPSSTVRSDTSANSKQEHPSKCPGTDSFGTPASSFSTVSQNSNGSVAIQMPLGPPSHEALRAGSFMNNKDVPTSQMPSHLIPAPPPHSASARIYQPNEVPSQFATEGVKTAIADSSTAVKTATALTPTPTPTTSKASGSTTNSSTGTGTSATTPASSSGSVLSTNTATTTHGSYLVKSKSSTSAIPDDLPVDVTQRESLADLEKSLKEKKDGKKSDSKPASEPKSDPKKSEPKK